MSGNVRGSGNVGNATFGLALDVKPLLDGLRAAEQFVQQSSERMAAVLGALDTATKSGNFTGLAKDITNALKTISDSQLALPRLSSDIGNVDASWRDYIKTLQQAEQAQVEEAASTTVVAETAQKVTLTKQEQAAASRAAAQAAREEAQAQQESARAVQGISSGLLGGGGANNALGGLLGTALTGAEFGAGLAVLNEMSRAFHDVVEGAIDFNATLQTDAIRLETFTGSLASANQKLAELQQLAASPAGGGFKFDDLEKGEEILQRFGEANDHVRQIVADTAAGTGLAYSQVAQLIGEMYDRLDNGLPVARTVLTLERAGIVTGDYARQIDAASKAGATNAQINDLITASLARYSGAAQEQGHTFTSVMNENKQALDNFFATAGKPVLADLTHDFDGLNKSLDSGKLHAFAQEFAQLFTLARTTNFAGIWEEFGIAAVETFVQIGNAFDKLLQSISGGHLTIGQQQRDNLAGLTKLADGWETDLANQVRQGLDKVGQGAQPNARKAGTDTGKAFGQGFQGGVGDYYKDLVAGLSESDLTALGDIQTQVQNYLKNSLDSQGQPLDITPQIKLDLTEVISQQGDFQQAAARLKEELGTDEYNAVLQLSDAYKQLATDTVVVNYAQGSLADTTKALADVQDKAKVATQQADNAVKAAQATAQQHAQAVQDAVQAIRDQVDALDRDQRQVDAGLQQTIDGLTRQQKALQDASKERQQQYQEELKQQQAVLEGLNAQLKADRDNASTHADAFKAIEQGTLDIFYQEHDALDETTRKIIERYQAEIDGAERAKEATEDKAGNLEADQRKQLLALDEQIQTARENNDTGRLAALEAERKAYLEKSQPQIDLERERAAVAKDDYDARVKNIQTAADKQAAADKAKENADQKAVDAQQAKIKGIQDAQQAQQAADQQALDNLNQQIQQVQEEKKQRDDAYNTRKQQLSDEQQDIERNGRTQAALDAQHVKDTQTAADNVKAYWDTQISNAQHNKDIADATLKAAQDKEKADKDDLQHIQGIIKAQEDFYTKYPQLLPGAKNIDPGATPGPGGDHPTPQDWQLPATPPQPSAPGGVGPTAAARPLFAPASSVQASAPQVNVNIHNPVIADVVGANQVKALVVDGVQQGLAQQAAADRAMWTDIQRGGTPAGALIGA